MPQAIPIHTRFVSNVPCLLTLGMISPAMDRTPSKAAMSQSLLLDTTCRSAMAIQAAMTALSASVAELAPTDPRHPAAHAAVDLLAPRWREQVGRACRLVASSASSIQTKAMLLGSMVERDENDAAVGGPMAQLAASLAADVLAYEWDQGG